MAVYHGPACRQCRREGVKLMLKGDRCRTEKCAMERRPYAPGQRSLKRRRNTKTEYSTQLREKQKIRRIYGVLERQFRRYFVEAARKDGVTGENLLRILESRLDNVVFRLGFAPSRATARQLVLHNHVRINGKKVNVPSLQVGQNDIIEVREKSKGIVGITNALKSVKEVPAWLTLDKVKMTGTVVRAPDRTEMPGDVQEQLVVELYSK